MKRVLIIGPSYPAPYNLPATPNDVANFLNTLSIRGYTSFQTYQGTISRNQMLSYLQAFISGCQNGDAAAVVLLGHGGRLPGSEPDGYDECWVASDLYGVRDHEIGAKLAQKPGVKFDVVSEFCNSGTSTDNNNVRTWCACGPTQNAWWGWSGGVAYSLFSLYLCYALRNYPGYNASQFMSLVRSWIVAVVPSQVPQLDGNAGLMGQKPF